MNDCHFATRFEGWKRSASGFAQDGLMAIADGFTTGESTSSGFFGVLKRTGILIETVFTVGKQAVSSFTNAWIYDDGEVTSSGGSTAGWSGWASWPGWAPLRARVSPRVRNRQTRM